ncbi:MAG: hypothetical protein EOP45_09375 [Sphingobacteriaceae bacterium]|nr:MAG: hypothetical protein EOP45_09375 [Sphingobacteriaceae bacterium]
MILKRLLHFAIVLYAFDIDAIGVKYMLAEAYSVPSVPSHLPSTSDSQNDVIRSLRELNQRLVEEIVHLRAQCTMLRAPHPTPITLKDSFLQSDFFEKDIIE